MAWFEDGEYPVRMSDVIGNLDELHALYGEIVPTAVTKELDHLTRHYRRFIEVSPFMVLATAGDEGLDCSPRGDPNGFVRIVDDRTLMFPDRRGNNRLDSLRNIVREPRVALLFLLPGINETFRVNGHAVLSTNAELCASFAMGEKVPACVVVVTIDSAYTQCPKALVRSKLWDPSSFLPKDAVPSSGERLEVMTDGAINAAEYDAAYPARMAQTIY
jgi:uncharacterized protein